MLTLADYILPTRPTLTLKDIATFAVAVRDATASKLARHDSGILALASESIQRGNVGHVAQSLSESKILIWDRDIFKLAINGATTAFAGKVLSGEMFDYEPQPELWVFHNFAAAGFYCACVYPQNRCLTSVLFRGGNPDNPVLHGASLSVGSVIDSRLWPEILACREFTRQKIAAKEPVLLPRSDRRRMQREQKEPPAIRFVQLRGREASIWHGADSRQYHHSWIVRGHWRNLHEPRKKDGAVATWIESYMKGQGPLLQPREPIFSVSR